MERICEFCAGLRPIIYCKPDAAHLCLSCDAKVHSANALSGRHIRTLLCDLCGNFPMYLQCLDHQMFLCRNCDRRLHDAASRHQKQTIRGYMGCPSARDLAALWGFEINELDGISQDQFASTCGSENSSVTALDIPKQTFSHMVGVARVSRSPHVSGAEHKVGSLIHRHRSKMPYKCQEQSSSFILQQILDLNRLQLTNGNNHSPLIRGEDKDGISSSILHTLEKFDETLNQHLPNSRELRTDLQQRDDLLQELKMNPLPISFSQLENLPFSSAIVLPLHGESLWQCKSPAESSQLWSQNMEDLGVCDELVCHDDFNIPEVDLTFQNIEDIFDGDEDPTRGMLDTKDESYSSMDKDMPLDKSDNRHGKGMEASSVTSSTYLFRSALMDKDMDHSDQFCYTPTSTESPRQLRPSSSTLSFSGSRLSIDSAGSDCLDRMGGEPSCSTPCSRERKHSVANNDVTVIRNKEKKQSQLQDKQIQPSYRKARSIVRKRVKGRYAKPEQHDSDTIAASRSY